MSGAAGSGVDREVECRRCRVYCTWVVRPSACLDRRCPNVYLHDDERGRRYVGCLQGVFTREVDLDVLRDGEARGGFGALRCSREPLPICAASVERAYPRRQPEIGCVNPEFAERVDGDVFHVTSRD